MAGDFETFLRVLVSIAASIATIGGALSIIERYSDKAKQVRTRLSEQVSEHEKRLANDHRRLGELETSERLIMRGVMQLMSHEIDGNHTEQLKATRDDMESYLINK